MGFFPIRANTKRSLIVYRNIYNSEALSNEDIDFVKTKTK